MRAECIAAVRAAAEAIGKQLTLADIQGIDAKMYQKQKILAKQDITAWRAMSRKEQLTKAGESVVQDAIHDAIKKRARANLTILSQQKREQTFGKMIASGMTRMDALRHYTFFKADGKGGVMSMESHSKAIAHSYLGKIQALRDLENQGSIGGLVTNKQGMLDYLKESYGIDSGNPLAKRAWQEVDAARNQMIDDFNRVGGDVAKLTNYRNPQGLDAYRVITRGGDGGKTFVDDHMKLVDKSEYNNPDGSPMTDGQLRNFLHEAFVTVSTDGANKPMSEGGGGASAVANRMRAHRQIHYKSPEAYLFAMEKYGAGNPFDQTRSSFEAMARDIALVEKFGPNAINEFNKEFNRATLEMTSKEARSLFNSPGGLKASFERFSGQRTVANVRIAEIGKTTRSSMVANKLGSMLFAQLADSATLEATARAMNIPKSEILKWHTAITTDPHLRENLRAHGHGVETMTNNVARFADDSSSSGFYGKAATAVTTIQGAHVWTRGLRQVFSAMMEAKYGGLVSRYTDMSKLHERDRALLESKGVDDTDWAIWRMAKPDDYKGSKLLSARSLEDVSLEDIKSTMGFTRDEQAFDARRGAALKLQAMMVEETHMAVLQPSELQGFDYARGTVVGEIGALILQFKSFPWALFRQHFIDRANFKAAGYNPTAYRARLLVTSTILGGAALILNDLASGKDPREVFGDDPEKTKKFTMQAMLKGGGLPVIGDMLELGYGSVENPYQTKTSVLGPALGFTVGTVVPTMGTGLKAMYTGDDKDLEDFTKNAYDSVRGVTPGQNLWFLKGFLHNVMLKDLQETANPGYTERARQRAEKNYGTGYWMGMDEETRPPDLSNISGQ